MIRTDKADLLVGHQAHVGTVRRDSHAIVHFQPVEHGQPINTLAIVAHGMWGFPVGKANKVAADIVVDTFVEKVSETTPTNVQVCFSDAIATASLRIRHYREIHPEIETVVASCAVVLVMGGRLYTVSVGNCRVYLLRKHNLHQISTDHTAIQMLIEKGYATTEELERGHGLDGFPFTRCLGGELDMVSKYEAPDFRMRLSRTESDAKAESNQGSYLEQDDEIMLCTDGLHGSINLPALVKDEQIRKVWLSCDHPQQSADVYCPPRSGTNRG